MKIRQAKKIMMWSKGDGDYYSLHRSKKRRDNYRKMFDRLRPGYRDERGVWVQPSCHDIDIIRRAHTRLFQWIRRGFVKKMNGCHDIIKKNKRKRELWFNSSPKHLS